MVGKKMGLGLRIATLIAVLSISVATPGMAVADGHEKPEGPKPMAVVGILFGGVIWLVSTPFSLLFAPTHIMDSFDDLVEAPWRVMVGSNDA